MHFTGTKYSHRLLARTFKVRPKYLTFQELAQISFLLDTALGFFGVCYIYFLFFSKLKYEYVARTPYNHSEDLTNYTRIKCRLSCCVEQ